MLRNYLVVAVRDLWRQKFYTAISVIGLSASLACAVLIYLHLDHETGFDRFHENLGRIYRVGLDWHYDSGQRWQSAAGNGIVGPTAESEIPGIEAAVRLYKVSWEHRAVVKVGDQVEYQPQAYYADARFFDVFTFPLMRGDPKTALHKPNSVVLSARAARRFFGDENPVGKQIAVQDTILCEVTGVLAPQLNPSHLRFELLISYETILGQHHNINRVHWGRHGVYTYVLLAESASAENVGAELYDISHRHWGETEDEIGLRFKHFLEPIEDIYLKGSLKYEDGARGDIRSLWILTVAAVFTVLVASLNHMNLATARSIRRAREVGIRKTVGARRSALVFQFLVEAGLTVGLALIVCVSAVVVLPHWIDALPSLILTDLFTGERTAVILALGGFVALLSGSYPALVLSSFGPTEALKGSALSPMRDVRVRHGLVIFQFMLSILLLVGTFVVRDQVRYMITRDPGYAISKVLAIPARLPNGPSTPYETLRSSLLGIAGVEKVSGAGGIPGGTYGDFSTMIKDRDGNEMMRNLRHDWVDWDYVETLGLEMVAGRSFSRAHPSDLHDAFVLNETAVRYLGWGLPEEAVGLQGMIDGKRWKNRKLIGVIKDYHYESLHREVEPILLEAPGNDWDFQHVLVRLGDGDVVSILDRIEQNWKEVVPNRPFVPAFLGDSFERHYRPDRRLGALLTGFSALSVGIASIGLIGLVGFIVSQRTKEVGVRKALGAGIWDIVKLFTSDFTKLVLVANLIAAPIGYAGSQKWLETYAYHATFNPIWLVVSGALLLIVSYSIVSGISFRAGSISPAEALRQE